MYDRVMASHQVVLVVILIFRIQLFANSEACFRSSSGEVSSCNSVLTTLRQDYSMAFIFFPGSIYLHVVTNEFGLRNRSFVREFP